MTRAEAITMHQRLLDLHKHLLTKAVLDVFADAEQEIIRVLEDEIAYLTGTTDERWDEWTAGYNDEPGFIRYEMDEAAFEALPEDKRLLIKQHGIPIRAQNRANMAFKMTPHWWAQLGIEKPKGRPKPPTPTKAKGKGKPGGSPAGTLA